MARSNTDWTAREEEYLLENWWDPSKHDEVVAKLNRSKDAVREKFYSLLREKKMSPRQYRALYAEMNGVSHESSPSTFGGFMLFKDSKASPRETTKSQSSSQKSGTIGHFNGTATSINQPVTDVNLTSQNRAASTRSAASDSDVAVRIFARYAEKEPNETASAYDHGSQEEQEITLENLIPTIKRINQRLEKLERRASQFITISHFAMFAQDMEGMMKQVEALEDIIRSLEEENSNLKHQRDIEMAKLRQRVEDREKELTLIIEALSSRLEQFYYLGAGDKLLHLGTFLDGIKDKLEEGRRIVNRRLVFS